MSPGVNSASKNEYPDNPGVKGGRCIRLTTYLLHVPIIKKSGGLNLLEPCGPVQACNVRPSYKLCGSPNELENGWKFSVHFLLTACFREKH